MPRQQGDRRGSGSRRAFKPRSRRHRGHGRHRGRPRRNTPGGKMRRLGVGGRQVDAGPTVLTMRWVFERLFEMAGTSLVRGPGSTRPLCSPGMAGPTVPSWICLPTSRKARGPSRISPTGRMPKAIASSQPECRDVRHAEAELHRCAATRAAVADGGSVRSTSSSNGRSSHFPLWSALGEHFSDPRLSSCSAATPPIADPRHFRHPRH
jgi:1-hydroxycarotenoid 3,4-desaturase